MRTRHRLIVVLVVACLALSSGCGGGSGRRPLGGQVSFQGRPVEQGSITFLATGDRPGPVAGALIRDGRYDIPAAQGLLPDTYRVAISWPRPGAALTPEQIAAGASPQAEEQIPPKFNTETTLTAEVKTSGSNQFDFELP
jgi:hypothetical protein